MRLRFDEHSGNKLFNIVRMRPFPFLIVGCYADPYHIQQFHLIGYRTGRELPAQRESEDARSLRGIAVVTSR